MRSSLDKLWDSSSQNDEDTVMMMMMMDILKSEIECFH